MILKDVYCKVQHPTATVGIKQGGISDKHRFTLGWLTMKSTRASFSTLSRVHCNAPNSPRTLPTSLTSSLSVALEIVAYLVDNRNFSRPKTGMEEVDHLKSICDCFYSCCKTGDGDFILTVIVDHQAPFSLVLEC